MCNIRASLLVQTLTGPTLLVFLNDLPSHTHCLSVNDCVMHVFCALQKRSLNWNNCISDTVYRLHCDNYFNMICFISICTHFQVLVFNSWMWCPLLLYICSTPLVLWYVSLWSNISQYNLYHLADTFFRSNLQHWMYYSIQSTISELLTKALKHFKTFLLPKYMETIDL